MANIASQKKRILRSERERTENRLLTSTVKTHFRRLESAVESRRRRRRSPASTSELVSRIDKAIQKGALHKNTGARKKSRAARLRLGAAKRRRRRVASLSTRAPARRYAPAARLSARVSASSSP